MTVAGVGVSPKGWYAFVGASPMCFKQEGLVRSVVRLKVLAVLLVHAQSWPDVDPRLELCVPKRADNCTYIPIRAAVEGTNSNTGHGDNKGTGVYLGASSRSKVNILALGDSLTKGQVFMKCGPAPIGPHCSGSTSYRYFLGLFLQDTWGPEAFQFIGTRSTQACSLFATSTTPGCSSTPATGPQCIPCTYPWDKGHEGHRAWTTRDVLDGKPGREPGVREFVRTGPKADIVLLMIGNNDVYKPYKDVSENRKSIENIRLIIKELHGANPQTIVLFMELPKFGPKVIRWSAKALKDANRRIEELNIGIRQMITQRNDTRLRFVRQLLTPTAALMSTDGVHHSPQGEAVLAKAWSVALPPSLAQEVISMKARDSY